MLLGEYPFYPKNKNENILDIINKNELHFNNDI